MNESNLVRCPICLDNYNEEERIPRMFPECFHSVCSVCLRSIYKNPFSFDCPTCRKRNHVFYEQVPRNRYILEFLEQMKSVATPDARGTPTAIEATRPVETASSSIRSQIDTTPLPPLTFRPRNRQPEQPEQPEQHVQTSSRPEPNISVTLPIVTTPDTPNTSAIEWNEDDFLKKLFDEIDHNRDGYINFEELLEALKKGLACADFDQQTVKILIEKFDQNSDSEISSSEFHNLFAGVNDLFIEFLEIDQDASSKIDKNELKMLMSKKGMTFSDSFYDFLYHGILLKTNNSGITFDIYVRVNARLDKIKNDFRRENSSDFESYVVNEFFNSF